MKFKYYKSGVMEFTYRGSTLIGKVSKREVESLLKSIKKQLK